MGMIVHTWLDHLEKIFSYEGVQFEKLCPPVTFDLISGLIFS